MIYRHKSNTYKSRCPSPKEHRENAFLAPTAAPRPRTRPGDAHGRCASGDCKRVSRFARGRPHRPRSPPRAPREGDHPIVIARRNQLYHKAMGPFLKLQYKELLTRLSSTCGNRNHPSDAQSRLATTARRLRGSEPSPSVRAPRPIGILATATSCPQTRPVPTPPRPPWSLRARKPLRAYSCSHGRCLPS